LGHAAELTVLDIRPVAGKPAVEWLIFATARSHSHMRTLARSVTSTLKSAGVQIFGRPPMVEGANAEDWMLVDAGKSVISILTADCRRSLNLEEHWQGLGAVTALQMPPAKLARATEAAAAAAASDLTGGDFVPGAPGDEIYRDDVPDSAPEYELRSARGRAGRAGATELMGEGADADEYEWEYCDYEVDYYEEEEGTTQLLDARGVGDGGGGGGRRGGGAARDLDRAADKAGRADGEADASAVEGEGYEYEEEYGYEYSEYSEEEEGEYGYEYEESYEEESYDDEEGGPVEERGGPRRSGDPPRKAE
jgi:ribosomal silencing factor RsfS